MKAHSVIEERGSLQVYVFDTASGAGKARHALKELDKQGAPERYAKIAVTRRADDGAVSIREFADLPYRARIASALPFVGMAAGYLAQLRGLLSNVSQRSRADRWCGRACPGRNRQRRRPRLCRHGTPGSRPAARNRNIRARTDNNAWRRTRPRRSNQLWRRRIDRGRSRAGRVRHDPQRAERRSCFLRTKRLSSHPESPAAAQRTRRITRFSASAAPLWCTVSGPCSSAAGTR